VCLVAGWRTSAPTVTSKLTTFSVWKINIAIKHISCIKIYNKSRQAKAEKSVNDIMKSYENEMDGDERQKYGHVMRELYDSKYKSILV